MCILILLQSFCTTEINQFDISLRIEHDILAFDIAKRKRSQSILTNANHTDERHYYHEDTKHLRLSVEYIFSKHHYEMDRKMSINSQ